MDAWLINALVSVVSGAVSGGVVAIFAEPVRAWLLGPKVAVDFRNDAAHVAKTPEVAPQHQHMAIYVRVSVTNRRGSLARGCTGYLVKVERKDPATGKYEGESFYDPTQLSWASRMDHAYDPVDLPRGVTQYLDVLSTRDFPVNAGFRLETRFKPFRELGLGSKTGMYRLTIMVSGDNFSPTTQRLDFQWTGAWDAISVSASGH